MRGIKAEEVSHKHLYMEVEGNRAQPHKVLLKAS